MSRRVERVSSLIRSILAKAIQTELQDPRIPRITSITEVEVSADFSIAKVYVSVFSPTDAKRRLAVSALQSSAGHLRWLLGHELRLRKLPMLVFKLDETIRKSFETYQIIDQLNLGESAAAADDADGPADDDASSDVSDEPTLSRPETGREEA